MCFGRRLASSIGALFLLWLSACAELPHPASEILPQRDTLQSFSLDARFSLRHTDKNYAGRLTWQHDETQAGRKPQDVLLIVSPLGQGVAEIRSDATEVRLKTSDGKSYTAENVEDLTQQVLGYPLPLAHLAEWIRGRSVSGESLAVDASDAFRRPLRLRQDGWRIDYEYDNDDPQALPVRLFIAQDDVLELRLRIDAWYDLPATDSKP